MRCWFPSASHWLPTLSTFTFRHLIQIASAYLTGKVQEPPSSCRPPVPHPFPDSECPKYCTGTPIMSLHRRPDTPAATRAWVGWRKFWRWSPVSILYFLVVDTVLIYGPNCLVQRASILTVFFWRLAPGVFFCLKVILCVVMG